jgi:hypothetical protein
MVVKDRESVIFNSANKGKDIFLLGKSISKWSIVSKYYTSYDQLEIIGGTKRITKYNYHPRILIRRTGNTLCCAFLGKPALTESTLYSCWSTAANISNKYLLALLNSKLFCYYVKKLMITNKQAFPQILMTDLENLPLLIAEPKKQETFTAIVDQILAAKQRDSTANISPLEQQIDSMVYDLYKLSPKEIEIVENVTQ